MGFIKIKWQYCIPNAELELMWKGAVMPYLEILSQKFGGTEENGEKTR
jgi:hypothetical protein